jgi:hypothetical protein
MVVGAVAVYHPSSNSHSYFAHGHSRPIKQELGASMEWTNDAAKLIAANQDLPIRVWVSHDTYSGYEYQYSFGRVSAAKISKVLVNFDLKEGKVFEWDDLTYVADLAYDSDPRLFDVPEGSTDAEAYDLATEYVKSLPWEECILLLVGP